MGIKINGVKIAGVGAPGLPGKSGVYFGTEPPTDPEAKVWISEEAGADAVSSASAVSYNGTGVGVQATNVQSALDELFESAGEGKALIAAAVTSKGVETAANATCQQIADNVGKISGNAQVGTCTFTETTTQRVHTIPIYRGDGDLLVDYSVFPTAGDIEQTNAKTAEYITYTDLDGGKVIWRHVKNGDTFEDVPW